MLNPTSHHRTRRKSSQRRGREKREGREGGEEERGEKKDQGVGVMTHKKLDVVRVMK
jgi:hypothetical protein